MGNAPLGPSGGSDLLSGILGAAGAFPAMRQQHQMQALQLQEQKTKYLDDQLNHLTTMAQGNQALLTNPQYRNAIVTNFKQRGLPPPIDPQGRVDLGQLTQGDMQKWLDDPRNAQDWYGMDGGQRLSLAQKRGWAMTADSPMITADQTIPFGSRNAMDENIQKAFQSAYKEGQTVQQFQGALSSFQADWERANPGKDWNAIIASQYKGSLTTEMAQRMQTMHGKMLDDALVAQAKVESAKSTDELKTAQAGWYRVKAMDQGGLDAANEARNYASAAYMHVHTQIMQATASTGGKPVSPAQIQAHIDKLQTEHDRNQQTYGDVSTQLEQQLATDPTSKLVPILQGRVANARKAMAHNDAEIEAWQNMNKPQTGSTTPSASTSKVTEGTTGTYNGQPVIWRNGKWEYQ